MTSLMSSKEKECFPAPYLLMIYASNSFSSPPTSISLAFTNSFKRVDFLRTKYMSFFVGD